MKELEGGFINRVYLENGVVVKIFGNDALVGMSSVERMEREMTGLRLFGGAVAPRLLSYEGVTLKQEFIGGELYETKARRGEQVFQIAGTLLSKIHSLCSVTNVDLQTRYDARFKKAIKRAGPILKIERLSPVFNPSWEIVCAWGTKYIHGDFWLGNIIGRGEECPKAIDWEFSDIGSPYEDFAIVELWIFREFSDSEHSFWTGYGRKPDQKTINAFLILRCVEFLATTTLNAYLLEEKDGFYHNKVSVLRTLCV